MGKWCPQASSFIFNWILVKLARNQDRHKILDKFKFRLDRMSHFGVMCPWRWIKFSIDLLWNLQVQLTFQMKIYWVPCGRNSSYSFPLIVLKLFRCFLHGMKICVRFGYKPLIIFSHFFCLVNLVSFLYEMLSFCHSATFQMKLYWVPYRCNPSNSFPWNVLKLCRCFLHGMKMCMWFEYNNLIFLFFFFIFLHWKLTLFFDMKWYWNV